MTNIKLKRVYEDYDQKDGFRVLVDRLWPREMKKEYLHYDLYDLWAKNITPSLSLRKFFHENTKERWDLFVIKYRQELQNSQYAKDFVETIQKYTTVTLLYASKDPIHNHVLILKDFLNEKLSKK